MEALQTPWTIKDVRIHGISTRQEKYSKTIKVEDNTFYIEIIKDERGEGCSLKVKDITKKSLLGGFSCFALNFKIAEERATKYIKKKTEDK